MTELRGEPADVSSDAIVPLQVDAASGPEQVISEKALETGARSLGANAWRDLRGRPMFWISLALIVLFLVMAIFPQLFTSKDPAFADLAKARQTPSAEAWFGYDAQGYDVYTRTVYGARASVSVGILATLFSLIFGAAVGIIAGYRGGWLDSVIGRIAEIFLAIPLLLGGILFLYTFPNQVDTPFSVAVGKVAFVIAHPCLADHHPVDALQRAAGQAERLRASRPGARRLARTDHQLPHPAELDRLGDRGVDDQPRRVHRRRGLAVLPRRRLAATGDLMGQQISDASGIGLIRVAPHMLLFPSLFLSLTVLSFIMLGDVVRDALDPRLR